MVTVDPIENVEKSIDAQREEIVAGDRLRLAGSADHVQLRKDRHGFEIDGECPENLENETCCSSSRHGSAYFERGEFVIPDEGQCYRG